MLVRSKATGVILSLMFFPKWSDPCKIRMSLWAGGGAPSTRLDFRECVYCDAFILGWATWCEKWTTKTWHFLGCMCPVKRDVYRKLYSLL